MYPWDVEISLEWAYGAFSYVGQVSDGCELHDTICRATGGLWDPICWITAPIGIVCNGAHAFTYGPYYDYNYGYFITKSVERRDLGRCFIPS
jgi:hypothetical protein